jgi:hypothetical protein
MGVSETFWNFLVDFYGTDFTIEMHKHENEKGMEPEYKESETFLSY